MNLSSLRGLMNRIRVVLTTLALLATSQAFAVTYKDVKHCLPGPGRPPQYSRADGLQLDGANKTR